jgi:hypothetical protein
MRFSLSLSIVISIAFCTLTTQAQLLNASPLKAGGAKGYAPLRIGYTISDVPIGFGYTEKTAYPSLFLRTNNGLDTFKGIYISRFSHLSQDGNLVYKKPVKIDHPEGLNVSQATFFPFKEKTLALFSGTNGTFVLAEYEAEANSLKEVGNIKVSGLGRFTSMSANVLPDHNVVLTFATRDNTTYLPTDAGGNIDTQSYYDGAGLFRGVFPRGGVREIVLNIEKLKAEGTGVRVSKDEALIISPTSAIKLKNGKVAELGNVVTNSVGAMKYLTSKTSSQYLWTDNGKSILVHPTQGAVAIAFPSAKKEVTSMVIGGEGSLYHYELNGFKNTGEPIFHQPKVVLMENGDIFAGTVASPNVVDWDGDHVLDLVVGNSEGRLLFYKNKGTTLKPDFAMSEEILSAGTPICFRPGYQIVQGPLEGAWGYLGPTVYDWNGDGLPDVIFSGSDARFSVMINRGTKVKPILDAPKALSIDNLELWGPWRVRPAVGTINGKNCIITVDQDNALHLYHQVDDYNVEDAGKLKLTDGNYITGHQTVEKRLGNNFGRVKLALVDWNGDGKLDVLLGCMRGASFPRPKDGLPFFRKDVMGNKIDGLQVLIFINAGTNENMKFKYPEQVKIDGNEFYMGIHENSPTPCGLGDTSKGPNLLVGVESGKLMFFEHKSVKTTKN